MRPPLGTSSSPRFRLAFASSRAAFVLLRVATLAQIGDLTVHVLDDVLELVAIGPGLGHLAAHLGLSGRQISFRRFHGGLLDGDLNAVRLRVKLNQYVSLLDVVVVIHQDRAHLADHPGATKVT